jgi:Ca2+-binding EF-hand superfamily protein
MLGSVPAVAQQPEPSAGASVFEMLDADKSGSIDIVEAQVAPGISKNFDVADKNADGLLTKAEFDAAFATAKPSQPQPSRPRAPRP